MIRGLMAHVIAAIATVATLAALSTEVMAHKPSDSYLTLSVADDRLQGRWDIALRDLEHVIGLDADGDGTITWGEVRVRHPGIAAYALSRLRINGDGERCELQAGEQLVDAHSDGAYAVLRLSGTCPHSPSRLSVQYRLLASVDAQHRGLLQLTGGDIVQTAVLNPQDPAPTFELYDRDPLRQFVSYAAEGVWHIWIGFDHILFLVALLLPAGLIRCDGRWRPAESVGRVFLQVAKIVTAFTIAHSLTLACAVLGIVSVPARLVESIIAASVVLAALNNVFPLITARLWLVAFLFGLIHGLGFAGVLAGLDLPPGALVTALIGFNVGVEIGQLAIVAAVLPLLCLAGHWRSYARAAMPAGSLAVAAVAGLWLVERALDLRPPDLL